MRYYFFKKMRTILRTKVNQKNTGSERNGIDLALDGFEILAKLAFRTKNQRKIEDIKKQLTPLIEKYNKKVL